MTTTPPATRLYGDDEPTKPGARVWRTSDGWGPRAWLRGDDGLWRVPRIDQSATGTTWDGLVRTPSVFGGTVEVWDRDPSTSPPPAPNATVVELYRSATPTTRAGHLLRLRPQRWRFRTRSSNCNVLTVSSEAYRDRADAVRAIALAHPGLGIITMTEAR